MQKLKQELKEELLNDILPYWMNKIVDNEHGGFYGCIDGHEQLHKQANKGAVMNARILWTFAAAYRMYENPRYLAIAERAFRYILDYFIDKEYGGVYWELDYLGHPVSARKQIYAQGFAVYGFSEFYRATGRQEALDEAVKLFRLLEKQAYDPEYGGYIEALNRDWQPVEDMKLSAKDANVPKSMNTHLHVLEPYTNLLRVWRDSTLIQAQERLIHVFCKHIISSETRHLILFFDNAWHPQSEIFSYGHDIECSWLLYEAAEVLGDTELLAQVKPLSIAVAKAAYEGLQKDGSLIYESEGNRFDRDRHWWVQAEMVAGSACAYKISNDAAYLQKAKEAWSYIKNYMLDKENGEWFWSVHPDGKPNRREDKAGFWKCPYHNARMCMEIGSLME
ncbi:MAG: AGE family epimerase/isomerase [Dysgonamonadaceae bacterium]|jgi:mannobiose 2-epimerase|nr:AGE family epimerase/isomerase [Dysgonamonadaceae bacterium]